MYKIPFQEIPQQVSPPKEWNEDFDNLRIEINNLLAKNAVEIGENCRDQFLSPCFLVKKPDGLKRFILNLKELNLYMDPCHFKMEDIRVAKNLITQGAFMRSLDLKDAFFLIPIHESDRKSLGFNFNGVLYQFTCLPFGLCISPYVFTKIMKPVINALRVKSFISVIYLDEILCIDDTYDSCSDNLEQTSINILIHS